MINITDKIRSELALIDADRLPIAFNLQQKIKELIEEVIDLCAEEAKTTHLGNNFVVVEEESILAVKKLIIWEE